MDASFLVPMIPTSNPAPATDERQLILVPRSGVESGHPPFGCLFFGTDDPDLGSDPGEAVKRPVPKGVTKRFHFFLPRVNLFSLFCDYIGETGFIPTDWR